MAQFACKIDYCNAHNKYTTYHVNFFDVISQFTVKIQKLFGSYCCRLDQMFSDAFAHDHQLLKTDPKRGLYLACGLIVRGSVEMSDIRRNIDRYVIVIVATSQEDYLSLILPCCCLSQWLTVPSYGMLENMQKEKMFFSNNMT